MMNLFQLMYRRLSLRSHCNHFRKLFDKLEDRFALTDDEVLLIQPAIEIQQSDRRELPSEKSVDLARDLLEGSRSVHPAEHLILPRAQRKSLQIRYPFRKDASLGTLKTQLFAQPKSKRKNLSQVSRKMCIQTLLIVNFTKIIVYFEK